MSGGTPQSDHAAAAQPIDTKIDRASALQTIMGVAFLILVALFAFLAAGLIGDLIGSNPISYWIIELIFALLCGGAGAMIGGSAYVRSTFNIPGAPIHGTLGGAAAMVIVGFAVAYAAQPAAPDQSFVFEIQDVPASQSINGISYNVYVGPPENNGVWIARANQNALVKVPAQVATYTLNFAVYFREAEDTTRVVARCELALRISHQAAKSTQPRNLRAIAIEPESDRQYRLYFPKDYVSKVVEAWTRKNKKVVTDAPCIEGPTNGERERELLGGTISLVPVGPWDNARRSVEHLSRMPRFMMLGSVPSPVEAVRTVIEVPAGRPESGGTVKSQFVAQPTRSVPPVVPAEVTEPAARLPTKDVVITGSSKTTSTPTAAPNPLRQQVDAYLRGEDMDRTSLYSNWSNVADYVVEGFRIEAQRGSPLSARYLNLISNALSTIQDGEFIAPTRNPGWDESRKSERLRKTNIPGFVADDYQRSVDLLCSKDSETRLAAQRLLRLYPADKFWKPIHAAELRPELNNCDKAFFMESAIHYYYNRIVEYDGSFTLSQPDQVWLADNYKSGVEWAAKLASLDEKKGAFGALLDFGYAIVLWDHKRQPEATQYFKTMLDRVRRSAGPYPSNPRHIATALKQVYEPGVKSKLIASAIADGATEVRILPASYEIRGGSAPLLAVPEIATTVVGKLELRQLATVYLRAESWDLLQYGDQLGWARRTSSSAQTSR